MSGLKKRQDIEMKKKDKLNFPVFKSESFPPSIPSLDEINKWIEHDYQFLFNRRIYEKEKRLNSVNVRFKLIPKTLQ